MTSITSHPVSPEELMAFLDGQPGVDASQIATHLESCKQCQAAGAKLRGVSATLSSWAMPPASSAMDEPILAAAKGQPSPAGGALRIVRRWTWRGWILAGAGAVLGVFLLLAIRAPNLLRSKIAANEAALAGRSRTHAVLEIAQGKQATDGALAGKGQYQGWLKEKALPAERKRGTFVAGDNDELLHVPRPGLSLDSNGSLGKLTKDEGEVPGPMIARTANLYVVVPKFETARSSLDAILMRYQAYAASLEVTTTEGAPRTINASLRVPSAQLGAALADMKALGRVENESQSGEEVTEQHADLVARLKNSRETEVRLEDVLGTRTGKVKDVLEVEQEISRVRGEIEQMEAQQKNLEHRVDFATLNLTMAEEYKAKLESNAPSLGTRLRNSMVTGFRNAFDSFFSLILFLSEALPVLLLWLAILSPLGWFVWRRFRAVRTALT